MFILFLCFIDFSCASREVDPVYLSQVNAFRESKDQFLKSQDSPLKHDQRQKFDQLEYFPVDPAFRFYIEIDYFDQKDTLLMATSTGKVRKYLREGKISFDIDKKQTLTLFKSIEETEQFFLPFKDATNGGLTYPSGRYLDPKINKAGKLVVDFNYAYNPYCAYNDLYDCPIPPVENHLSIAINAGEKKFTLKP
jgi:hypothetical protein